MKKAIAALLLSYIFIMNVCALASCAPSGGNDDHIPPTVDPPSGGDAPESNIAVPPYKDYGRGTVNFSELKYERPDVSAAVDSFNAVTEEIKANTKSFNELLSMIESIEADYTEVRSMYTLSEIMTRIDSSDGYYLSEYEYMTTSYPSFTQAVEDLFVACAKSENKERFEKEYFGASLDSYVDGGIYTDEVVKLMSKEAELEAEYSGISTATVKITFAGVTDTVDNILALLSEMHTENSAAYRVAKNVCMESYYNASMLLMKPIFVELFRTRRLLSDELGHESYSEYAYGAMGHDYSEEQTLEFLEDISEYVYPVFKSLYTRVFYEYFNNSRLTEQSPVDTVNALYSLYEKEETKLYEIYSYMLQHGLYDIDTVSENRYSGAFTTYIELNNSPFLFMSAEGSVFDLITLSHEFGHFADGYINYGSNASLDLSEVSSQALELLTTEALRDTLNGKDHQYLEYYECYSALNVLIMQGFYSAFEHIAYSLPYDEISEESLCRAVEEASLMIFGEEFYDDISYVMIPHTVLYPYYVQSYCTSITAALEIFFLEVENDGDGFDVYMDLIERDGSESGFSDELIAVGLSSPFSEDYLKSIADKVYYHILGSHYHYGKNANKHNKKAS